MKACKNCNRSGKVPWRDGNKRGMCCCSECGGTGTVSTKNELCREIELLRGAMDEAMDMLKNIAVGGIGEEGPTLEELDNYAEKTGSSWHGDADYHTAQWAWRKLQQALNTKKGDMAHRQNAALRLALQQIAELSDSGECAEYASAEIARKALEATS